MTRNRSVSLGTLIEGLGVKPVAEGVARAEVTGVADDSRRVQPGYLFIARPGTADDGAKYIADAIERGAVAVLSASTVELPEGVAGLVMEGAWRPMSQLVGEIAERFHDRPSQKLRLIGVTGTNGKTTVAWMIRHLLNALGGRCGLISTIEVDDGATVTPASLTTPGACELSELLGRMTRRGCTHAVMECSSHALDQGRCEALDFDAAVFTNLTGDHLDYHGTVEAYAAAKAKLFESLATGSFAIVNEDDPAHLRMTRDTAGRRVTCSSGRNADADYPVAAVRLDVSGVGLSAMTPRGVIEAKLGLIGGHNLSNLSVALAAVDCVVWGLPPLRGETAKRIATYEKQYGAGAVDWSAAAWARAIETCPGAPGRLERVTEADAPFAVFVDYAHTDDALQNVLTSLRPLVGEGGKLRVMFGAGGDRDWTKRPRMGSVAAGLADAIVVTSDNPRSEDPQAIIDDIMEGVPNAMRAGVVSIVDRREAIERIIADAGAGDIVLLAGKGHEDYQLVGDERRAFDDRLMAREVLEGNGRVI